MEKSLSIYESRLNLELFKYLDNRIDEASLRVNLREERNNFCRLWDYMLQYGLATKKDINLDGKSYVVKAIDMEFAVLNQV